MLTIADNQGNILAPCILAAVNVNDSKLFPDSLQHLNALAGQIGLKLSGSFLTLDSGFYGERNHEIIEQAGMIPVIKPNHRNTKDQAIIKEREDLFAELAPIYHWRWPIERCFAWEDKYRRLVVRYEKKQAIAYGWRFLAAALVNFRTKFGRET